MTRSSAQLERDADQTRADLEETLDELRRRISPGQVLDQTLDYARDGNFGHLARNLGRDARDNPLPLLLIGAGIAWLMFTRALRPLGDRGAKFVSASDESRGELPPSGLSEAGDGAGREALPAYAVPHTAAPEAGIAPEIPHEEPHEQARY